MVKWVWRSPNVPTSRLDMPCDDSWVANEEEASIEFANDPL
jgi:hypothetical protein